MPLRNTTTSSREVAIIVGVILPGTTRWQASDALDELEQLALTAGARVTDRVTQSLSRLNPATFIGSGKVNEVKRLVAERDADLVIFDDDLAPVQIRNLERDLKCKLLDRSGLILDIFAGRAQTAAAKTQVELAQLDYTRSRLTRRWTHLSRQKGGIGTKGPGETQIETDRRLIDDRMSKLKDDLEKIDQQRKTQRKGRRRHTRVSVVGYTNAGKSTLMNTLSEAGVLAEDQLFATLDATTRTIELDANKDVLLSDTVGFIRKLPHKLIESFKSTLDEVRESDVLLHVVDVTHPRFKDHMRVVTETLKEIDAGEKRILIAFNKVDALENRDIIRRLRREFPEASFCSALRGIGLDQLKQDLLRVIEEDYVEHEVFIPVTEPKAIAYLHSIADVSEEEYLFAKDDASGSGPQAVARLRFRVSNKHLGNIRDMAANYAAPSTLLDYDLPAAGARSADTAGG